jgi:hypothetical protein
MGRADRSNRHRMSPERAVWIAPIGARDAATHGQNRK